MKEKIVTILIIAGVFVVGFLITNAIINSDLPDWWKKSHLKPHLMGRRYEDGHKQIQCNRHCF
jgi:hypothetical protein